ncbi:aminomethyl-transferring glycine dehydrogenase [Candidatus Mycalebacterium sp.]
MSKTYHLDGFEFRHIGSAGADSEQMLGAIGVKSLDELIEQAVPRDILNDKPLSLPPAEDEHSFAARMREVASLNKQFKSFIGLGYYGCKTPEVIKRNVLENPGWYTQYTPYQAEIAQGRLEALLNFQTVVCDLTAMDIANASLLDESTAACEAMAMFHRIASGKSRARAPNRFFVDSGCFPQTIEVLKSRTEPLGIEMVVGDFESFDPEGGFFGALLQFPDRYGRARDYSAFIEKAHKEGVLVAVAADILSLAIFTPPGEIGADAVVGSTQRFGVPMGCGGPHAAYFATRSDFQRQVPGRIIGVSVDRDGLRAYRMSLQTREQHIRREKATSNICTAQSLPAIMAAMYCVYHGAEVLEKMARKIHSSAVVLSRELEKLGFSCDGECFFDTLSFDLSQMPEGTAERIREISLKNGANFLHDRNRVGISLDETTETAELKLILRIFSEAVSAAAPEIPQGAVSEEKDMRGALARKTGFLSHQVFNTHHSETGMVRYLKRLENKDLSLTHSMIPLGSCTMKLNSASELAPVSLSGFANIHPFAPRDQLKGYERLITELGASLCEITGFSAASLQPNSGAQGEFAGLMVIRAYHRSNGDEGRNVVLVPSSAHGTNPASAAAAGMKVVITGCTQGGSIDIKDLEKKCSEHSASLAAIMITYPSTHGVFEKDIKRVCSIVHEHGGQVYMDGANLNAQVGITNPAFIGADLCHVNLHKTFSIPHGGGGPGMGPICVAEHLAAFLPGHPFEDSGPGGTAPVSSAPWGSASISIVSYAYIKLLGSQGSRRATMHAILNANYMKQRLARTYKVLYEGDRRRVAHEFILDLREFKKTADIEVEDFAKRLMDYGFHAPTVSWPVAGTIMIEPTESESKAEIDRFCEALEKIRAEIAEIESGSEDRVVNVLKNSPHTAKNVTSEKWDLPYSRQKACFPADFVAENKFWPAVSRIDNAYGDRNLFCTCPPPDAYEED